MMTTLGHKGDRPNPLVGPRDAHAAGHTARFEVEHPAARPDDLLPEQKRLPIQSSLGFEFAALSAEASS